MLFLLQGGPPAQPGQVRPQDQECDLRQRQRRVRVPQGGERHRQRLSRPSVGACGSETFYEEEEQLELMEAARAAAVS